MSVDLPKPIAAYFAAENSDDAGMLANCFTTDAVVQDERQTIRGLAAIKQWMEETHRKYQHRVVPLASRPTSGNIVVTSRLTGRFPGSPIELQFLFTLEGEKISALEIRS
jgi:ketosteroid isomerase-like protein